jgi:hypothetical protein
MGQAIDYVNRELFDKPDEYYTLDKLRRAAGVDRRLTLREILEKDLRPSSRLQSKDELLEEEFEKFLPTSKTPRLPCSRPPCPGHEVLLQGLRHRPPSARHHRNQAADRPQRVPAFGMSRLQGRAAKWRTRIPEYVKDYVHSTNSCSRTGFDQEAINACPAKRAHARHRNQTPHRHCRDILVGKVPDPKSQVEQITIALIYKFMDDMDAEAEELGGKRSFFAGDTPVTAGPSSWRQAWAATRCSRSTAKASPRCPRTPASRRCSATSSKTPTCPTATPKRSSSFLKEIDEFTYDHSERLGDAFEYLLSVLGSQGDAGQFRTPRHIIDFMVEVLDPQKNETILDPACGTAGFLISAWKHILKANTTPNATGDL